MGISTFQTVDYGTLPLGEKDPGDRGTKRAASVVISQICSVHVK